MEGASETARREWVIREITPDRVRADHIGDGRVQEIPASLMPEDVAAGDVFRVVAQLERRVHGSSGTPPVAGAPIRRRVRWRLPVKDTRA